MLDIIARLRAWADRLERVWIDGAEELGLSVHGLTRPAPTPTPTPTPTPGPLSPTPYVGPSDEDMWEPPLKSREFPIVPLVHATCWGNKEDEVSGEWSEFAYGWAPQPSPGLGKTLAAAAVPFPVQKGDAVRVRLAAGPWHIFPIVDKGPWNTKDSYLLTGARPQAEGGIDLRGRKTNKSGLDLTPAAWALVLGRDASAMWGGSPSGELDVQFIPSPTRTTLNTRIRNAALNLPDPFPYQPETQSGDLGCADVVSYALREAGAIDHLELSVKGLVSLLKRRGWSPVRAPFLDGDVIVWGPRPGGTRGHVGILLVEDQGQVITVQNSSSQHKVVHVALASYDRPVVEVLRA